ncbi:MAG: hypothetical protein ACHQTF_07070 [Gemmatimonadales bacterium]
MMPSRRSVALCALATIPGLGTPILAYAQHAQAGTAIIWVKYTDPVEHAFTVDGPRGYTVRPQEVRRGPIDYVLQTRAVAPDSSIDVRINDGNIPAFSEPTPLSDKLGLHEGMMTESRGQRFMIRRYTPALPFAYDYGKQMMAPFCAQPALKAGRPLPVPKFAAPATPISSTDVGEVYFECPNNGRVGYLYVITTRMHDPNSPIGTWGVAVLVGFVSARARAGEAFAIARHMAFSVSPNPQWYAGVLRIAQVQNDQIMADFDQQQQDRQAQLAKVDNTQSRDEQAFDDIINGVTPTVDPQTGEKREVATGAKGNYYWTDQSGHTVNTASWMAPGPNYRPLQVAPR